MALQPLLSAEERSGGAILRAWGEAGHLIANHSYSHWDLNKNEVTPEAYEAEVLKGEALADAVAAERGQLGFVKDWRARTTDPDDLLLSERRLLERMDQLGL